jgi:predicted  nucleic acid-binding Zn-ribbon protein
VSQDDLEERVNALEMTVDDINRRLRTTEQDAAAARVWAGAADRDVTEIRAEIRDFRQATTTSFNAMRADFVDLRQEMERRFEQVDRNFEQVDHNFEQVDRNFTEMRGKFDATAAGQQHITDLIQSLIDRGG